MHLNTMQLPSLQKVLTDLSSWIASLFIFFKNISTKSSSDLTDSPLMAIINTLFCKKSKIL